MMKAYSSAFSTSRKSAGNEVDFVRRMIEAR
jgi:hypothetical protein